MPLLAPVIRALASSCLTSRSSQRRTLLPIQLSDPSFFISATKRGSERSGSKIRSFLSHPIHCGIGCVGLFKAIQRAFAIAQTDIHQRQVERQNMTMQRHSFESSISASAWARSPEAP